jgi:hypothetical protein
MELRSCLKFVLNSQRFVRQFFRQVRPAQWLKKLDDFWTET